MIPNVHVTDIALPSDCREAADALNRGCVCQSVDHDALRRMFELHEGDAFSRESLAAAIRLFSDTRVYVAEAHLQSMADLIGAIESVIAMPAWRERILGNASAIAHHAATAAGVFLGYDFHLGPDGPRLIEINTNAGGGLLNAKLLRAQIDCCTRFGKLPSVWGEIEGNFVEMFRNEWRLERGAAPLKCIAIVDETPFQQFLAAEFALFQRLFEGHGIDSLIVDPGNLIFDGKTLRCGERSVDVVYNRLTDFALEDPRNKALRDAWLAGAIVLTPHPRAHALYADKRNLTALTDVAWLRRIGVGEDICRLLVTGIPRTEEVRPDNAEAFWVTRKQWFFKPAGGFGSKAAYRGDKLTKRVFGNIAQGGYVAQALVPPSEKRLLVDGVEKDLKVDLRNYVYQGKVQLVSARLYQGQTTNFRTPGGGFAAVFSVGCQDSMSEASDSETGDSVAIVQ